jgi:hypothetical protein
LTYWFLLVLALAWIAVFLPAAMRARQNAPLSTSERFRRRMELIAPRASAGRWVVVPESGDHLAGRSFRKGQRTRRRILTFLVAALILSVVGAIFAGGALWELTLAFGLSLALYVSLLVEAKKRRDERTKKVRRLQARTQTVQRAQPSIRVAGGEGNGYSEIGSLDVPGADDPTDDFALVPDHGGHADEMTFDEQIRAFGTRRF